MVKPDSVPTSGAGEVHNALAVIRSTTSHCHSRLENAIDWAKAFSTPAQYVELLRRFHRVVEPLEYQLQTVNLGQLQEPANARSDRLQNDIDTVGKCYSVESQAGGASHFGSIETIVVDQNSAWGVQYVLEGSALGGQILARQLQDSRMTWASEKLSHTRSCEDVPVIDSYFVGRGQETGSVWRHFCHELNHELQSAQAVSLAAQAAVKTFELFHSSLVGKAVCIRL